MIWFDCWFVLQFDHLRCPERKDLTMATPTATRGPRKVILNRMLVAISNNESPIASEVEAMVDVEEVAVVVTFLTSPIMRFAKKCSWAFLELPISSKCKAKLPFVIVPMEDEEDVVRGRGSSNGGRSGTPNAGRGGRGGVIIQPLQPPVGWVQPIHNTRPDLTANSPLPYVL